MYFKILFKYPQIPLNVPAAAVWCLLLALWKLRMQPVLKKKKSHAVAFLPCNSLWQITVLACVFVFMPVLLDKWKEMRDYCGAHSTWVSWLRSRMSINMLSLMLEKKKWLRYFSQKARVLKFPRLWLICCLAFLHVRHPPSEELWTENSSFIIINSLKNIL